MSFQRMHSDLSNERALAPSMRRIHSDISGIVPPAGAPGQHPDAPHEQPPPLRSLDTHAHSETSAPKAACCIRRERSVHQILGGGKFADALLWKQRRKSAGILGTSTVVWFLFEWSGYTLISLTANVMLFFLIVLFAWANLVALVNRPLPPVPELQLSDEKVHKVVKRITGDINALLAHGRNLTTGKDFPMLLKACLSLWILSAVGQWFSFLTLIYLGVVGTLTLPLAYERHDQQIDRFLQKLCEKAMKQYHKLDERCLSKIPLCCK